VDDIKVVKVLVNMAAMITQVWPRIKAKMTPDQSRTNIGGLNGKEENNQRR